MKFVRLLLMLCTLCAVSFAQGGGSSVLRYGTALPNPAKQWTVFVLTSGQTGLYMCTTSPTCTTTAQWNYFPLADSTDDLSITGNVTINGKLNILGQWLVASQDAVADPPAPATGYTNVYTKAGQLCSKNPAGTVTCGLGGGSGSGVASINSTTGAFTFSGSGVSCSSTTCTFSGGGAVSSVFGRTGAVVSASGDYSAAQITGLGALATFANCSTANQVPVWNGSAWVCATPSGSGLTDPGAVGIVVESVVGSPATTITRSISGGYGIAVSNANGVSGNPNIYLSSESTNATAQTASYTAQATDFEKYQIVTINCASPCTVTLPSTVPPQGRLTLLNEGAAVTIAPNGVTLTGSTTLAAGSSTAPTLAVVWIDNSNHYWSYVPTSVSVSLNNPTLTGTVTEPVPVWPSSAANMFMATPYGSAGSPSLRAIVAADIPVLNQNTTGTAGGLSGTPALPNGTTATTQSANDSSADVATDAFVVGQAATVAPLADGTAAVGTSKLYARQDHVHPSDTTKITDPAAVGVLVETATGSPATVMARTLAAGTGLGVSNGNGVSGNPNFYLSSEQSYAAAKTASYSATSSDFQNYKAIPFNCSSACNFTLPSTAPATGSVFVINEGAAVTIVPNGITMTGPTTIAAGSASAPVLAKVWIDSSNLYWSATWGGSSSSLSTSSNCSSSAVPAVCGSAQGGSVAVAAGSTTLVVNTTAVTANSQIMLQFDSSLGTKLSVTCNTNVIIPAVISRTAGTSFTIGLTATPATNPACYSYTVVN
jgi:hypothetical protein